MGWWRVQPCEEEDYSSDSSESLPNVKRRKEESGVGGNWPNDDDDDDEEGLDEGLLAAAANGKMSGMSGNILEEEDDDEEEGEGMSAAKYEREMQHQKKLCTKMGSVYREDPRSAGLFVLLFLCLIVFY